jgi:hypothetical protein
MSAPISTTRTTSLVGGLPYSKSRYSRVLLFLKLVKLPLALYLEPKLRTHSSMKLALTYDAEGIHHHDSPVCGSFCPFFPIHPTFQPPLPSPRPPPPTQHDPYLAPSAFSLDCRFSMCSDSRSVANFEHYGLIHSRSIPIPTRNWSFPLNIVYINPVKRNSTPVSTPNYGNSTLW